jgi:hypothetical protein
VPQHYDNAVGLGGIGSGSSLIRQRGDESQKAVRLLQGIRADAIQVRSAALRLDSLTKTTDAKWLDYDRQWNEIKPAVEDMQIKLARLETMQGRFLPPSVKRSIRAKC